MGCPERTLRGLVCRMGMTEKILYKKTGTEFLRTWQPTGAIKGTRRYSHGQITIWKGSPGSKIQKRLMGKINIKVINYKSLFIYLFVRVFAHRINNPIWGGTLYTNTRLGPKGSRASEIESLPSAVGLECGQGAVGGMMDRFFRNWVALPKPTGKFNSHCEITPIKEVIMDRWMG